MKFKILGCGSSMGVPRSDGDFGNCDPKEIKNYRTRCSALVMGEKINILIDSSPDLRHQLLTNNIKNINYVLYSHMHADQTHGINDLRVFYLKNRKTIPVYADNPTSKYLRENFTYCFKNTHNEYPPILNLNKLKNRFILKDNKKKIIINSIKVKHGKVNSICYVINKKIAYISDVSEIKRNDFRYLKDLQYLIIDCLWYEYHPSHLNLEQSLDLIKKLKPKKAILTNLHSKLDYNLLKKDLPKNVIPAFDGLTIKL